MAQSVELVGGHGHHQAVETLPDALEQAHVADVEQVEGAVGQRQRVAARRGPDEGVLPRRREAEQQGQERADDGDGEERQQDAETPRPVETEEQS